MNTPISGPRKISEFLPVDSLTLKTPRTPQEHIKNIWNSWLKWVIVKISEISYTACFWMFGETLFTPNS